MLNEDTGIDINRFINLKYVLIPLFSADNSGFCLSNSLFCCSSILNTNVLLRGLELYVNLLGGKFIHNIGVVSDYLQMIQLNIKLMITMIGMKPFCLPFDFDFRNIYALLDELAQFMKHFFGRLTLKSFLFSCISTY